MDARGYGRSGAEPAARRRVTAALLIVGLFGVAIGLYGVLDATAAIPLAAPIMAGGAALLVGGMVAAGRRVATHALPPRSVGPVPSGWSRRAGRSRSPRSCSVRPSIRPRCTCPSRRSRGRGLRSSPTIGVLVAATPAWIVPPPMSEGGRTDLGRRCDLGSSTVIQFHGVSLTYPEASAPTLRDVQLAVEEGELCLVAGRTGAGKSTLLRLDQRPRPPLHRRPPHRPRDRRRPRHARPSAARAGRRRRVGRRRTRCHGFVTDTRGGGARLRHGAARRRPRRRCAGAWRRRSTCWASPTCATDRCASLSGGQQQRVAIGSVLDRRTHASSSSTSPPRRSTRPRPRRSSPPSPGSSTTSGVTVVLAEHRHGAGRPVRRPHRHRPGDGTVDRRTAGRDARRLAARPARRRAGPAWRGWSPLPLVGPRRPRERRRRCGPARRGRRRRIVQRSRRTGHRPVVPSGSTVAYGPLVAVRDVDARAGARAVRRADGPQRRRASRRCCGRCRGPGPRRVGQRRRRRASIRRRSAAPRPAGSSASSRRPRPTCSTSTPSTTECRAGRPRLAGSVRGRRRDLLDTDRARRRPGDPPPRPVRGPAAGARPRRSSSRRSPKVVLLDEPTRGLDYPAKASLGRRPPRPRRRRPRRSSSRPTTSSSSRRSPTASS